MSSRPSWSSDQTSQTSQTPALRVQGLSVRYHEALALEDVSFEVAPGRLVGVIGPNGAGKSTLIKAIVGACPHAQGHVEVLGRPARQVIGQITYVPQRGAVDWDFPVNVWDVVCQGRYGKLGLFGRMSAQDKAIVERALEQVELTALKRRQIGELSGGQQQRVFLARALAQQGQVYLLDEPFAGVDARTEAAIIEVLGQLRDQGKAVLVVHHDLATVPRYFDDVLLLNRALIAAGPTAQTFTPPLLQRTYGGRLAVLSDPAQDGATVLIG